MYGEAEEFALPFNPAQPGILGEPPQRSPEQRINIARTSSLRSWQENCLMSSSREATPPGRSRTSDNARGLESMIGRLRRLKPFENNKYGRIVRYITLTEE